MRKRRWIQLSALMLLCLGYYFGCVHRYRMYAEQSGWAADFRVWLFRCPFCTGRLEHFTYRGRPVPLPTSSAGDTFILTLYAPVGHFETRADWRTYRAHWVGLRTSPEAGEPVTADELARGYYELALPLGHSPARRPGTPAYWCFGDAGDFIRWLDPELIDDLPWSAPTSAPTTQPP